MMLVPVFRLVIVMEDMPTSLSMVAVHIPLGKALFALPLLLLTAITAMRIMKNKMPINRGPLLPLKPIYGASHSIGGGNSINPESVSLGISGCGGILKRRLPARISDMNVSKSKV